MAIGRRFWQPGPEEAPETIGHFRGSCRVDKKPRPVSGGVSVADLMQHYLLPRLDAFSGLIFWVFPF